MACERSAGSRAVTVPLPTEVCTQGVKRRNRATMTSAGTIDSEMAKATLGRRMLRKQSKY